MKRPNIYLDIDDVIFDWGLAYAIRYNTNVPKYWTSSVKKHLRLLELSKDKDFWMSLPVKNVPNFKPKGFVSARGIPVTWTKQSLKKFKIPGRSNVYQVSWGSSKLNILKELKCDLFIDDKVATFEELNKNGIPCLLMTAAHNKNYKTKYRISSLDINTIMNLWQQLK